MRRAWLVGFLVVLGGCGSTPTARPDGGGGGGGGGARAGVDSGVCANLACLQTLSNLVLGCAAGESCVYRSDRTSTAMTETRCYDNGVRILTTTTSSTDASTSTVTLTFQVKKDGTLCFSKTAVESFPAGAEAGTDVTGDVTTLDGSGTLVASVHSDPSGVMTVTCPGSPPTVLDDSCGFSRLIVGATYLTASPAPLCVQEVCSF